MLIEHIASCKSEKKTLKKTIENFRAEQMKMHAENRKSFQWMLRAALTTAVAAIGGLLGSLGFLVWYVVTHPQISEAERFFK